VGGSGKTWVEVSVSGKKWVVIGRRSLLYVEIRKRK